MEIQDITAELSKFSLPGTELGISVVFCGQKLESWRKSTCLTKVPQTILLTNAGNQTWAALVRGLSINHSACGQLVTPVVLRNMYEKTSLRTRVHSAEILVKSSDNHRYRGIEHVDLNCVRRILCYWYCSFPLCNFIAFSGLKFSFLSRILCV